MLWINLSHHLPTTFPQFFSQKVPTTASLQWQQMESETLFTILFSKLKPSKKLQACYKSSFQLAKFGFVSVGRGRKLKSCSFFGLTLVICKKIKENAKRQNCVPHQFLPVYFKQFAFCGKIATFALCIQKPSKKVAVENAAQRKSLFKKVDLSS